MNIPPGIMFRPPIPNVNDKRTGMKRVNVFYNPKTTLDIPLNIPEGLDLPSQMVRDLKLTSEKYRITRTATAHLELSNIVLDLKKYPVGYWVFLNVHRDTAFSSENNVLHLVSTLNEFIDTHFAGEVVCNIVVCGYSPTAPLALSPSPAVRHATIMFTPYNTYEELLTMAYSCMVNAVCVEREDVSALKNATSKTNTLAQRVGDMFLLPNVRQSDLKAHPSDEYCSLYGTLPIYFNLEVPYCSRQALEDYIFIGDHDWTDLEVPHLPVAYYGMGQAVIYYALYHRLDISKRVEQCGTQGEEETTVTMNLIKIFNSIAWSCVHGVYAEAGIPRGMSSEGANENRFYSCPLNTAITFYVKEVEQKARNAYCASPAWEINIHNNADGQEAQVIIPRI